MNVETDSEGYLVNRDDWTPEIAKELSEGDGMKMTDEIMELVMKARSMYDEDGVVPPIRKFSKATEISTKELYNIFTKGPMKLICKWGGLPKPTGCV